jgi:hypothetical protein
MKIIVPLLLLATAAGASHLPTATRKASLNKEFTIKLGQRATIKNLSLKFRNVQNESRCPTGVQCVWAGNAAIAIQISNKNTHQMTAILNTNPGVQPNELDYKGYKIRLVALNPYPKVDQKINDNDYAATLIVTKDKSTH